MQVQIIKETDNTVVLLCSNISRDITGKMLADRLLSMDESALLPRSSVDEERYNIFCDRLGLKELKDDSRTREGYKRLSTADILKEQVDQLYLWDALSDMTTWLDPCLLTGDDLILNRGLGPVGLVQLEKIVSKISGLLLKWQVDKYKLFRTWFELEDG